MMIEFEKNFDLEGVNLPLMAKPFTFKWFGEGNILVGVPEAECLDFGYSTFSQQFEVEFTQSFWMTKYLVTQSQWEEFGYSLNTWHQPSNINYPIFGINWLDAISFCYSLNIKYRTLIPRGYHFSLPTEIQWEYVRQQQYEPDGIQNTSPIWKTSGKVYQVGQYDSTNVVCDMFNNVSEWCFDIATSYPSSNSSDWLGNQEDEGLWFSEQGELRTERGSFIRSDGRTYTKYNYCGAKQNDEFIPHLIGFRVCLRPITKWDLDDPVLKKHNIIPSSP